MGLYEEKDRKFRYEIRNGEVAIIQVADENWSYWERVYQYDSEKDKLFRYEETEWESGIPLNAHFYITHFSGDIEQAVQAWYDDAIIAFEEIEQQEQPLEDYAPSKPPKEAIIGTWMNVEYQKEVIKFTKGGTYSNSKISIRYSIDEDNWLSFGGGLDTYGWNEVEAKKGSQRHWFLSGDTLYWAGDTYARQ